MMNWTDVVQGVRFGRLSSDDGWTYSFVPQDVVIGCRFIIGEKESHAETEESWVLLWTMANRMKMLWPRYQSLASMCMAYSVALHGDPIEVPRRARIQTLMPADIPDIAMERVVAFVEGRVSVGSAAGFVDFDQCEPGYVHPRLGRPALRSPSGECYWKNAKTESWDEHTIVAVPQEGTPSIWPILLGVASMATIIAASLR